MRRRSDSPSGEDVPTPPEIDLGAAPPAAPGLPGEHRGGFQRLPTGPVDVPGVASGPSEEPPPGMPFGARDPQPGMPWSAAEPRTAQPHQRRGVAGWALGVAIVALAASFVVGWCFPIGIVGVIVAVVALRRPVESRVVAGWALALALLSLLYSAGWLLWVAGQLAAVG
ncbi:hypothetical protein GH740_07330 [Microbacterium sp. SYP-A9085]|uniref:hypothetical protein n=1 Tax=Microbacterium sp. SYP-A9085 TaxID=2664454 RepID=UPI00129AF282|nr:hypothetical protein [Microbacterium sp. SYP-A9085]MRH29126.1 hypothetical protein [Microbacterium sp. SYP-A9085]